MSRIHLPVHAIRLPEKDEFSERFNYVGQLFDRAMNNSLPEDEQNKWWQEYANAKYCLEQGLPISFINLGPITE